MNHLIVHIGAPKCGSSSVQKFLKIISSSPNSEIAYWNINMVEGDDLESLLRKYDNSIENEALKRLGSKKILVISHEALYTEPDIVREILESLNYQFTKKTIVSYVRPSSKFIVSSYHQWHFRNKKLLNKITDRAVELDLRPELFTGLELYLIFVVDFIRRGNKSLGANWNYNISKFTEISDKVNCEIKVSLLPNSGDSMALINDFCNKISYDLMDDSSISNSMEISNPRFSEALTELISFSIRSGEINLDKNKNNELLFDLSRGLNTDTTISKEFEVSLLNYIDYKLFEENEILSSKFNLDSKRFEAPPISDEEISKIIMEEFERRIKENPIQSLRNKLLIELTKQMFKTKQKKSSPMSQKAPTLSKKLARRIKNILGR